jgi:F-type H+-transporting ATPase subunit c
MNKLVTVAVTLVVVFSASTAFAQDAGTGMTDNLGYALAAGLAIGIAALGGALAQGRATAAALESIGRNPGAAGKITTPMIIGLALIESLVISALVVAILISGNIS